MEASGAIAWINWQDYSSTSSSGAGVNNPVITLDSAGNLWVAVSVEEGCATTCTNHLQVLECPAASIPCPNNGWTLSDDISGTGSGSAGISLNNIGNSQLVLVYDFNESTYRTIYSSTWNGASWSTPVAPTGLYWVQYSSCNAISSTVYCSVSNSTNNVDFLSISSGAWSSPKLLKTLTHQTGHCHRER